MVCNLPAFKAAFLENIPSLILKKRKRERERDTGTQKKREREHRKHALKVRIEKRDLAGAESSSTKLRATVK